MVNTGLDLCWTLRTSLNSGGATRAASLLVVDDDDFVRLSLQQLLETHGYRVFSAASGKAALEIFAQEAVDLVLTDLRMPGIDGLEVLARVKAAQPHVAVVLLTGYSSLDSAIRALRYGADDYLLKPCREAELLERLRAALERQEVSRSLSQVEENLPAIAALVNAIEARDPYTRGHSGRVAHYAVLLAREVGLGEEETRTLWLAGLLHDIGKIGIRDAILFKPGPLDEEEYRRVKEHPLLAAQILAPIAGLRRVVPIVLHHHERYDGCGYPDGLAGGNIPLAARILAVVDGFEAMTSDRAYRSAFSQERALEILEECSGTQWDPTLVRAWVELVRAGRLTLPDEGEK